MKKIILLLMIGFAPVSCKDFLDVKPKDAIPSESAWKTEAKAKAAVNGIYSSLTRTSMYDSWVTWIIIGPSNFAYVRTWLGLKIAQGNASPKFAVFQNQYANFYRTIRFANDAIKNLHGNKNVPDETASRFIGEAKFIRGLCYFYLMNLYGKVIILREPVPPSKTYRKRNSVKEVRNFIIGDFKDAIKRLPVSYDASDQGRATKGAAVAMLGKVYLYDEQWDSAAVQFKKLMTSPYGYALTDDYFDNFYWKKQPNSETVFDLNYIGKKGYGSYCDRAYGDRSDQVFGQDLFNPQLRNIKAYTYRDGSSPDWSTFPKAENYSSKYEQGKDLIPWYQNNLSKGSMDARLHKNYVMPGATYKGKGNKIFKVYFPYSKYKNADPAPLKTTFSEQAIIPMRKLHTIGTENQVGLRNAPTNWPVIRYADVLLMYAEAKNESDGPSADVYNAINKVRNRAKLVNLPTGNTKQKLRRKIRLERYHEFPGEGILYFDTKRWGLADTDDPIFGLNRNVRLYNGETYYKGKFEKKDYLWPIPSQELDLNEKMSQNPGW